MIGIAIGLVASTTFADPIRFDSLVKGIKDEFYGIPVQDELVLEAAKNLFMSLATISLVWTMGLQLARQDIGEALMELLRFVIATGTLYWLLVNASNQAGGEGFVQNIVRSFFQMTNGSDSDRSFVSYGDGAVSRALNVYLKVIGDTAGGENADRIVGGLIGVIVLIVLTLLAAQFLLALIMAWLLGYGGIFLLGFGGSRWTSQIAISYYKHVVALGVAILALGFIGIVSGNIFASVVPTYNVRGILTYPDLGKILAVSLLMFVLGVRVPQLLYTLVTGSSLGIFAGTAGMVGSAIATGGGAAFASASGRLAGGGDTGGGTTSSSSVARSRSAMEAIERSAVSAGGVADPFHVAGGSVPLGVQRRPDTNRGLHGGSVFGAANDSVTAAATSFADTTGGNGVSDASAGASSRSLSDGTGSFASRVALAPVGRTATESPAAATPGQSEKLSPVTDAYVHVDDGAPRPDYLAEMAAITAARSGNSAYEPDSVRHAKLADEDTQANAPPDTGAFATAAALNIAHAAPTDVDLGSTANADIDSDVDARALNRQAPVFVSPTQPGLVQPVLAMSDLADPPSTLQEDTVGRDQLTYDARVLAGTSARDVVCQGKDAIDSPVLMPTEIVEHSAESGGNDVPFATPIASHNVVRSVHTTMNRGAVHPTLQQTDTQSPTSVEIDGQHAQSTRYDAQLTDNATLPLPVAATDAAGAIPAAADTQIPAPPGADSQRAEGVRNESALNATPWAGEHGVETVVQAAAEIHEADTPTERLNAHMQASGGQNVDDTTEASAPRQVEYPAHRSQAEDAPSNLALTDIPSSGVVRSPSATMDAAHVSSTGDASRGMDHKDRDTVEPASPAPSAVVRRAESDRARTEVSTSDPDVEPPQATRSSPTDGDTDSRNKP
jgi:P-type conjugative transfer protein TrbL